MCVGPNPRFFEKSCGTSGGTAGKKRLSLEKGRELADHATRGDLQKGGLHPCTSDQTPGAWGKKSPKPQPKLEHLYVIR